MYYKLKKLPTELKYLNLSEDTKPRSYDGNTQMYLGRKVVNNRDKHVYTNYNYQDPNWQNHNDSEKEQSKNIHNYMKGLHDTEELYNFARTFVKKHQGQKFINDFVKFQMLKDDIVIDDYSKFFTDFAKQIQKDPERKIWRSLGKLIVNPTINQDKDYNSYNYSILILLTDAFRDMREYNINKRDLRNKAKKFINDNLHHNTLKYRLQKRFKGLYRLWFEYPVKNAEGNAIEGSWISDSSVSISYTKEKNYWKINLSYGYDSDPYTFKADADWKNNVGLQNITVVDRKVITKGKHLETSSSNGIPMDTFEVSYIQRTVSNNKKKSLLV